MNIKLRILTWLALPVLLFFTGCSDPNYSEEYDYLIENNETIDMAGDAELNLLDRFTDSEVVFIGELHGIRENQLLTLKILKGLNRETGLRNYLAEVGYSSAWHLNKYIRTGDEALLDQVLSLSAGTYFGTDDTAGFLRELRALNLELPPEEQIRYLGIDIDHQPRLALMHLDDLAERAGGSSAPPAMENLLGNIPALLSGKVLDRAALFETYAKPLWADYHTDPGAYTSWCGAGLEQELDLTISSFYNGLYWYVVEECSSIRDGYIYETFEKIYTPGEKYIGLWGNVHTPVTVDGEEKVFIAAKINRAGIKVSSFYLMYRDSSGYNPRNPERPVPVASNPLVIGRFFRVNSSPAVFFDLSAPGSPFLYTDNMNFSGSVSNPATDYYQACILFNRAGPSEIYRGR